MQAGPELGGLLGGIREKQLQGELVTTKDALSWAQEQIARSAHGQPLKPRKSIPKYRGSSAMEKK